MTNDKATATKILMLIFALLAQIDAKEHTKKTDKLTSQVKKYLRKLFISRPAIHDKLAHEAENVWESAKQKILANHSMREYEVSLSATLSALYGLLEHVGYPELAFTERTFESALLSIQAFWQPNPESAGDLQIERWSGELIDLFAGELGIEKDNKLRTLKAKVAGNLLLSGKLKEEFA